MTCLLSKPLNVKYRWCIRGLHRFGTLPSMQRRELARAVIAMACARLALWMLPFRALRPLMFRLARATSSPRATTESAAIGNVAWALGVAARTIPAATCLVRALAAQFLLGRHGIESTLRLGVMRAAGEFRAHAWVECRGRVVVGGDESPNVYCMLPRITW